MLEPLTIILLLIIVNGIFSMAEVALISSSRARLEQMKDDGDRRAVSVLSLLDSPSRFLSTVQIGITVLGIFSGVYGGAHLASRLESLLAPLPISAELKQDLALALVVGLITYLSLVFGELLPKRFGMAHPERIAKVLGPIIGGIATVFSPAVRFLEWSTEGLLKLLPFKTRRDQEVTGDEIRYVIEQGAESGALEDQEAEIMNKVISLRERSVRSVMTPRTALVWLDATEPLPEIWRVASESGRSSLPVCDGTIDNVLGMIDVADLAAAMMRDPNLNIRDILWQPLRIPVTVPLLTLLEKFRALTRHVALVFDEYGATKGIITLHDLAEALLGELQSQAISEGPSIRNRPDGSMIIDAGANMVDLAQQLELAEFDPKEGSYHSLGGYVLATLGHIPEEGETFQKGGYEFEILDMDRYRIDKVLVRKIPS